VSPIDFVPQQQFSGGSFIPTFPDSRFEFKPTEPTKIKKVKELTRQEQDIIDKLNSLCFDQGGCRMI
jgi:hypothetical protein